MAAQTLKFYRKTAKPTSDIVTGAIYFVTSGDDTGIYVGTGATTLVKYANDYIHPTSSHTQGTSSDSPTYGGSFTVVDNLTFDDKGHVQTWNLKTVKLPADSNTHYTTHLYAGTGTAANAATENGNTKLTVCDDTTVRNTVTVKGTGKASVTSDANGVITVNAAAGTYEETPGSGNVTATNGYVDGVSLNADHVLSGTTKTFITDIANNGTSTIAPTAAAVKTYVDGLVNTAMHIKGTIGTSGADITTLPTTGVKVGDAWICKTTGTWAGQTCEVGDIIIATATTPTWTILQNNLSVATADKLGTIKIGYTTNNRSYAVQLDDNNKAYVDVPWSDTHYTHKLTIKGEGTTVTDFDQTAAKSLDIIAGSNVTVTPDATNSKITIAADDTHYEYVHTIKAGSTTVTSFDQKAAKTTTFAAGTALNVDGNTSNTVTYKHVDVSYNQTTGTAQTLSHGGKFTVLTGLTVNPQGHTTGSVATEFTLPEQYILPTASTSTKGGIKIGASLEMSSDVCNVVWTEF